MSIISSHGEEGVIFGCDSEPVKLTRIFRILSSAKCPALTKIPKIFFIQVTQPPGDNSIPFFATSAQNQTGTRARLRVAAGIALVESRRSILSSLPTFLHPQPSTPLFSPPFH